MTDTPTSEVQEAGNDEFFDEYFWTPVIEQYSQLVASRIANDHCGCGLWGLQRVGKTHFGGYLEKSLPGMFCGRLIVVRFQFIGRTYTKPEEFLKRCLKELGVSAITGRDVEALELKVVRAIQKLYGPHTTRVVLIWDEIQNVAESIWGELMYIEEAVRKDGMKPFLLCIGQPELHNTVALVEKERRYQAIGRMFQTADEFRGLTMQEVAEFLANLDGPDNAFSHRHFATRANAGWTLQRVVTPMQEALDSLANWTGLNRVLYMPASTLRQTLNALFAFLAEKDNQGKDVTKEHVLDAFKDNGFKRLFMAYSHALPAAGTEGAAA